MVESNPDKVLVLHLGRNNAGPEITRRFALAFESLGALFAVGYSKDAKIRDSLRDDFGSGFAVSTYSNLVEAVFGVYKLVPLARRITKAHRDGKVDFVFSPMETPWHLFLYLLLRSQSKMPIYVSVHDVSAHLGEKSLAKTCLEWVTDRVCSGIVVYSEYSQRLAVQKFRSPVIAVPHGPLVNHVSLPPDVPERSAKPTVAMVGRVSEYKGFDQAVEAIEILNARGRSCELVIWGSGDRSHLKSADASQHVVVNYGYLDEDEIPSVIDGADLILLPYIEASQSGIFGLAYPRARPVVCTPVGALPEVVHTSGAGVVANSCSSEDVADAIETALSDIDELQRACHRAWSSMRAEGPLSWHAAARRILAHHKNSTSVHAGRQQIRHEETPAEAGDVR